MSQLVWSPNARTDIQKHYDYLYPRNPKSASNAVKAITKSGRSLMIAPGKGKLIDNTAGIRKWPVSFGKYGFVIHYVQLDTEIVILRVYHGRQKRSY